jgi:formiminotetrahydrofolate cyclodeaminase
MKLIEMTLLEFLDKVDCDTAVPGGGSVAALSASLGAALSGMVAKLTLPKKRFLALDDEIKNKFIHHLETVGKIKSELTTLIDKDTEAYQMIIDAYKLPKTTEKEIHVRQEKVLEGTKAAIKVPFQVAMLSLEAMRLLDLFLTIGNPSAASDLGVACLMLDAAIHGAILNVRTNLSGLDQDVTKMFYTNNIEAMLKESESIKLAFMKRILEKMN